MSGVREKSTNRFRSGSDLCKNCY